MKALPMVYRARREPTLVEVPPTFFLTVDGHGDPAGEAYGEAIQALFAVAYTAKFALKAKDARDDFRGMPLETLWWIDDGTDLSETNKDRWRWTAMLAVPRQVTKKVVDAAVESAARKRPSPSLSKVRLARKGEGLSAQVLHVGPYDAEEPTITLLHKFIAEQGFMPHGRHHEIYLSDPRRTAPERIRTIIRQPVVR